MFKKKVIEEPQKTIVEPKEEVAQNKIERLLKLIKSSEEYIILDDNNASVINSPDGSKHTITNVELEIQNFSKEEQSLNNKLENKVFQSRLSDLLKLIKSSHEYIIIDDNNAIIINKVQDEENKNYKLTHVKLDNQKLIEVFSWNKSYNEFIFNQYIIDHEFNLLMPTFNNHGYCKYEIYNYKLEKLIAKENDWDKIYYKNLNDAYFMKFGMSFLNEYKGFLVKFELSSGDGYYIKYYNPVVEKNISVDAVPREAEIYFAILNVDGTIRGNKLFLSDGSTFAWIKEIINLDEYGSLENFKKQRLDILKERFNSKVLKFEESVSEINKENGTESPYLDQKVLKIIKGQ